MTGTAPVSRVANVIIPVSDQDGMLRFRDSGGNKLMVVQDATRARESASDE
jgi:hypothetical protein